MGTEYRRQKTEDRRQETGDRRQRTGDRSKKQEARSKKMETPPAASRQRTEGAGAARVLTRMTGIVY
jgi:hypothetical protein